MNGLSELLEKMIAAREATVIARLRAEGHLLDKAQRAELDAPPPAARPANDEPAGMRREAA